MSEIVPIDEYCQRNQETLMALASAAGKLALSGTGRSVECDNATGSVTFRDPIADPACSGSNTS